MLQVFSYRSGAHNVIEIPSLSCGALSSNGAKTLASQSAPTPVRVPLTQPGVRYFACSVSDHCDEGQLIQVTTLGMMSNNSANLHWTTQPMFPKTSTCKCPLSRSCIPDFACSVSDHCREGQLISFVTSSEMISSQSHNSCLSTATTAPCTPPPPPPPSPPQRLVAPRAMCFPLIQPGVCLSMLSLQPLQRGVVAPSHVLGQILSFDELIGHPFGFHGICHDPDPPPPPPPPRRSPFLIVFL